MTYEYRVRPAPRTAPREKGVKTTEERFALTLTRLMNAEARDGWEFLRAESLPCEERRGLTGRTETTQTLLVFRRALPPPARRDDAEEAQPEAPKPGRLVLEGARRR